GRASLCSSERAIVVVRSAPERDRGILTQIDFPIRAGCMPDKEINSGEQHQATRGGEHIVIRRVRPEDKALYPDFLRDVSAEDLRLRFFARVSELSARRATGSAISTIAMTWPSSRSMKRQARCSAWCA